MILKKNIFRAYDIRGIYNTEFDDKGAYLTALGFASWLKQKHTTQTPTILITGDGRTSTPAVLSGVIQGLKESGCTVLFGGIVPTPLTLFGLHHIDCTASYQITASHNGAEYNGMKMADNDGSICGQDLQDIYDLIPLDHPVPETWDEWESNTQTIDLQSEYEIKIQEITRPQQPLKIVIDAGNGIAGSSYPQIFRNLGHKVTELYCDVDGTFPNHQPDPEDEANMVELKAEVLAQKADIGFAFDGDGDRVGVVLSDGTIINADKIIYLLAADFLNRNPHEKIILDIMCSATLAHKLTEIGGQPISCPTGHSYVEHALKEHNSLLGGEQSGHFMFGENFYGHDDACLAAIRVIESIQNDPQRIDAITKKWPQMHEYKHKVSVPDDQKFAIMNAIQKAMQETYKDQANTTDGVRLDWPDGSWGIMRCSNTTPKISIRVEAPTPEKLTEKSAIFTAMTHKHCPQ